MKGFDQCGASLSIFDIDVGLSIEKQLNDSRGGSRSGIDQQAKPIFIDQINFGAFLDQNAYRVEVFPKGGQPERRITVAITHVDVGTVFD